MRTEPRSRSPSEASIISPASAVPIIRPSGRFLVSHPAHLIALGLGTGLAPVAPGTTGTLLAFPLYWLLSRWLEPFGILAASVVCFAVGVWACGRTGRALGIADHSSMNWDEVASFLAVLVFTPAGLGWQVLAFVLFRVFDVLKPPPIRHVDRTMKGGFGVMLDDVIAAGYTVLVLALMKHFVD